MPVNNRLLDEKAPATPDEAVSLLKHLGQASLGPEYPLDAWFDRDAGARAGLAGLVASVLHPRP
jgi:hypothetical protein